MKTWAQKFNYPLDLASKQSSVAIHAHLKEEASRGAFQEHCLVAWTLDLWVYKKKKRLKEAAVIKTARDVLTLNISKPLLVLD